MTATIDFFKGRMLFFCVKYPFLFKTIRGKRDLEKCIPRDQSPHTPKSFLFKKKKKKKKLNPSGE